MQFALFLNFLFPLFNFTIMKFRSQFSNVHHHREHNNGVKHPDFNDNVRVTVAEFIEAFANGTPLQKLIRPVEFDNNPNIDDDMNNVFDNPLGDKDIIDLHSEINDLNATTTNDDANVLELT